jgi:hypothetical protein
MDEFRDFAVRDYASESIFFSEIYESFMLRGIKLINTKTRQEISVDAVSVVSHAVPEELWNECKLIYDMFFRGGSDYELNINYSTAKRIHEQIKQPSTDWKMDIYSQAHEEIIQLLFKDTFYKFSKRRSHQMASNSNS